MVVSVGFTVVVVSVGFTVVVVSVCFTVMVVSVGFTVVIVSVGFTIVVVSVGFTVFCFVFSCHCHNYTCLKVYLVYVTVVLYNVFHPMLALR